MGTKIYLGSLGYKFSYFEAVIGVLDTAFERDDFNEKSFPMQPGNPTAHKSSSPPSEHAGLLSRIGRGLTYGFKQGKANPKSYCRIEESNSNEGRRCAGSGRFVGE